MTEELIEVSKTELQARQRAVAEMVAELNKARQIPRELMNVPLCPCSHP